MARVSLLKQIKSDDGWRRVGLRRNSKERIVWDTRPGIYLIERRQDGKRLRQSAGITPSEALEAQKRRRLELEAAGSGLKISLPEHVVSLTISKSVETFVDEIKTFRKPLTYQKYKYVLELFAEHVAPKSDVCTISAEDVKKFIAWRKSKGCDPGTTLYTDRIILHNFFNSLGIENPVKKVPRLQKFRKRPVAYPDDELKKFFSKCNEWDRAFFSLALATGLRRGELQTLHLPTSISCIAGFTFAQNRNTSSFLRTGKNVRSLFQNKSRRSFRHTRGYQAALWSSPLRGVTLTTDSSTTDARRLLTWLDSTQRNGISTASVTLRQPAGCGAG